MNISKTKILATLGPAVQSQEAVTALVEAGADAFRINMSHGNHEQWRELISFVRNASPDAPILMDTRGPELRIMNVTIEADLQSGDEYIISTQHSDYRPYLSHPIRLEAGHTVLIDDGAITATVIDCTAHEVRLQVKNGGRISNLRKVTVPSDAVTLPILTEEDYRDIDFAIKHDIDGIALSFTQNESDVRKCRELISEDMMIIAKIESQSGVDAIEEIIDAADGIMVARGDLGVEMQFEEVPIVQKQIIHLCNQQAKPVIVATQMLESMIRNNRPTRAEASDVANAILDGADCVMLSAETAVGAHPIQTVRVMNRIALYTDPQLHSHVLHDFEEGLSVAEAISHSVYDLSMSLQVDAIITATASGFTSRMVSRFRPQAPIIAVAHDEKTKRQLALSWGVRACMFVKESNSAHRTIVDAVLSALDYGLINKDDVVITTAGIDTAQRGSTNLIEIHTVHELLDFHEEN